MSQDENPTKHFTDDDQARRDMQTIHNSMIQQWVEQNQFEYAFLLSEAPNGNTFQSHIAGEAVMAQEGDLNHATVTRLARAMLTLIKPGTNGEVTIQPYGKLTLERFPDGVGLVKQIDEGFEGE